MNLLAIDPGKYTGIVEIRDNTLFRASTLSPREIHEGLICGQWVYYKIWIIERFSLYPWKSRSLSFSECLPAQIIGAIKLYTYQQNIKLILQTAGTIKGAITDEHLKEMKIYWFEKLKNNHERDAAKHALYFLIKENLWNGEQKDSHGGI